MITLYACLSDGKIMSEVASDSVPQYGDWGAVYDLFQDEWGCKHPGSLEDANGAMFEIVTVEDDVAELAPAPGGVSVSLGEGTSKKDLQNACEVISLRLDEGMQEGLSVDKGLVEFEIVAVPDDLFLGEEDKAVLLEAAAEILASAQVGYNEGILDEDEARGTRAIGQELKGVAMRLP